MANSRVGSELQPVAGAGDMGGVDAVGRAKFGNGFGEVVTDGAFGEAEFGGDLCGGATVAGALKDLAFAIGEKVFVCAPGFGGKSGIDGAKTGVDAADGFSNLGGGALFEQVAAGSGNDRARGAESRPGRDRISTLIRDSEVARPLRCGLPA